MKRMILRVASLVMAIAIMLSLTACAKIMPCTDKYHDIEYFDAVEPTCIENGWSQTFICHTCGNTDEGYELTDGRHKRDSDGICERCGYGSDYGFMSINDGEEYSITNVESVKYGVLYIPTDFNGKRVSEINNSAFFICETVNRVVLPSTITRIETFAFYACVNLTEAYIPASVTFMGDHVFSTCGRLTLYVQKGADMSGWHVTWNPEDCDIVFVDDYEDYIKNYAKDDPKPDVIISADSIPLKPTAS